jgi:hypothetical protein
MNGYPNLAVHQVLVHELGHAMMARLMVLPVNGLLLADLRFLEVDGSCNYTNCGGAGIEIGDLKALSQDGQWRWRPDRFEAMFLIGLAGVTAEVLRDDDGFALSRAFELMRHPDQKIDREMLKFAMPDWNDNHVTQGLSHTRDMLSPYAAALAYEAKRCCESARSKRLRELRLDKEAIALKLDRILNS